MEQTPERDAALAAMLPRVAEHGWTTKALRGGLADVGAATDAALWLFSGPADMIEAYIDFADRRMEAAAAGLEQTRVSARVRALIALRLAQAEPERAAVRRAAALLSLPGFAAVAARSLARTVDTMWHAAGDRSADFSWYSKRALLAGVYGATLLHWLGAEGDMDATLSFLDRRLADVGRIGKVAARLRPAA